MPFVRKFKAKFARQLPKNMLALIEAHQAAALLEANDGVAMTPFKEFNRARPAKVHFPAVTIYRRRTGKIENSNGQLLKSTVEHAVEIAVQGNTEGETMDELETRVEAVDSILRQDTPEAVAILLEGFPPTVTQVIIDIPDHVYGNNVPEGGKHTRVAALTVTAELMEA